MPVEGVKFNSSTPGIGESIEALSTPDHKYS